MKRVEKLTSHVYGKFRRFNKRQCNRTLRRLSRRLLEDAPTKFPYFGFVDLV